MNEIEFDIQLQALGGGRAGGSAPAFFLRVLYRMSPSKKRTYGSRAEVWHSTAKKTSGGLMKNDLVKNKSGRIVSRSKHNSAKRDRRLIKAGYGTKKGKFGFVLLGNKSKSAKGKSRKSGKGSRKQRGGNPKPLIKQQ